MKRMWQSIVAFLASSKVLTALLEQVLKQGFSVLLLIAAIVWVRYEFHLQLEAQEAQITELRTEVKQCSQDVLTYYREDRVRTEKILIEATDIMKQLNRKLDE